MVHSIVFASAFVALIATVAAIPVPGGSVVDIDSGDYLGTDTIDLDYLLADAISAQDVEVKDIAQDIDVLSDDDDDFRFGEYGNNNGGNGYNGGNGDGNGGYGNGRPLNRPNRPNNGGGNGGNNGGNNHGPGCGCGCKRDGGLLSGLLKRSEAKGHGTKAANKAHMNMNKEKAMKANKE